MGLPWSQSQRAQDLGQLEDRLNTLIAALGDQVRLARAGVSLSDATAAGNWVFHGLGFKPRAAFVQVVGSTAANTRVPPADIGSERLKVYVSAACVVDLYVVL